MFIVVGPDLEERNWSLKKTKMVSMPTLGFSEEEKEGALQPHDDALVVTIRIGSYNAKRVLVD